MTIEFNLATLMVLAGIGLILIALLGDALKKATVLNIEFAALGRVERIRIGAFGLVLLAGGTYWTIIGSQAQKPAPAPVVQSPATTTPEQSATSLPLAPPFATEPATAPAPTAAAVSDDCLEQYFHGIPAQRVTKLEAGARDIVLIGQEQTKDEPMGLRFTENRDPVGALTFNFLSSGDTFRVDTVIDSKCQPVEEYSVEGRPGEKRVLQNWDTLQIRYGGSMYSVRLGYEDGVIWAMHFARMTP